MTAAYNKINAFVANVCNGGLNFSSDTIKVELSNTATVATNSLYGDISGNELASGNGYTTGGIAATVASSTQTSGTETVTLNNVTWTATGSMGPFRYATVYDTATTVQTKPLICWFDYGSSITLNSGDTFTIAWNSGGSSGSLFTLT